MAYYNQILALVLIYLCVLYNNCIEGTQFQELEGGQSKDKDGKSTEVHHHSRIISNLFPNLTNDQSSEYISHQAGWFIQSEKFHGTRARISSWSIPNVGYNSLSAVYIAVMRNNIISSSMAAGFHVNPSLYSGSTDLRIFTEWTSENGMGCYNTLCQGFVLANVFGAPVPGEKVSPLSTFNGKDYFITLSIKKDEKTEDWSLYRDDNSNQILIGWWPKSLFNNTFDYATTIAWAGSVMYRKNETSPRMGSGHAACEGANKAAYISNIKVYDNFGQTGDPDGTEVREFTDRYDCFTTTGFKFSHGIGYHFYYGGPAGCIN